jgi:hypothetical protein
VAQAIAGQAPTGPAENETIVLGVDTHNDMHVAAVISTLAFCLAPTRSPPPPSVTGHCWPGPAAMDAYAAPASRAPAPTAPP